MEDTQDKKTLKAPPLSPPVVFGRFRIQWQALLQGRLVNS
jgi:hypothetical protein